MRARLAVVTLVSAWLCGCAGWPVAAPCPPVLPPQPVTGWSGSMAGAEIIELTRADGTRHQMLVVSDRSPRRLMLRGFNLIGLELFRLEYTDGQPDVEWLGDATPGLDARVLVSDYQFVHWPASSLAARLDGKRWRLDQGDARRTLYCRDQRVTELHHEPDGVVRLFNVQLDYRLEIRPVSAAVDARHDAH